jgi:hypothetical protein
MKDFRDKILQVIPARGLYAVLGDSTGYYTVKVSYVRLFESWERRSKESEIFPVQKEVPVIPYFGKLTGVDQIRDFLGVAESKERANGVWLRSLTKEQCKAYMKKVTEEVSKRRSFDWGGCARPAQVENMITQGVN